MNEILNNMHTVLRNQAIEVLNLAKIMNAPIPHHTLTIIKNWTKAGDRIWTPNTIRMAMKLYTIKSVYAYIYGYMYIEDLMKIFVDWQNFDRKFWDYGIYANCKYCVHPALRSSRLLPQY